MNKSREDRTTIKTTCVTMQVTRKEKDELAKCAESMGISKSAVLRMAFYDFKKCRQDGEQ